jgi:AraC-like DNA-binding protein
MPAAHCHNDIELNVVEAGAVQYRFGGHELLLTAGTCAVFWAAMPHQVIADTATTVLHWLHVPLTHALAWDLPPAQLACLLRARPIAWPTVGDLAPLVGRVGQWQTDLAAPDPARAAIVLLEVQAWVRRLFLHLPLDAEPTLLPAPHGAASRMAAYITTHLTEPLSAPRIAAAVGLHPRYAMERFQHAYGISLRTYLTYQRVARAQQLLVTTDLNVVDVAAASGFGTPSQFYRAFRAVCGTAPAAYRAQIGVPLPSES